MPLASVRKVLILLAVGREVAAGRLDPTQAVPMEQIERWYAPGTDGGAHDAALAAHRLDWTVRSAVEAMIAQSDNTATDWLLDRVGGSAALHRVNVAYEMEAQQPVPSDWASSSPGRRTPRHGCAPPLRELVATWAPSAATQVLRVTRKGGARVLVPLAPRTHAAIAEPFTAHRRAAGDRERGGRLDRDTAGRIVRRLARRADLGSPGASRSAPRLRDGGPGCRVPLRDVQDAAGHADPRATRRYDRGRMSLDRHATYAVAAWVTD